jgi:DNA-binding transcriptional ArsR family regulator
MTGDGCQCKVGRVAERRALSDLDDDLVERREREGASLRDLKAQFNRRVLRAAMERAGMAPLDGEVANTHRLLTDESVSAGERTRTQRRLQREGVDVESVRDDFVSHPTVGTHLRECLGVAAREESRDAVEAARERAFKMEGRAEAVVEDAIEGLVERGAVAGGDLSVVVDTRITCTVCGCQRDVGAFLDGDGCDCDE